MQQRQGYFDALAPQQQQQQQQQQPHHVTESPSAVPSSRSPYPPLPSMSAPRYVHQQYQSWPSPSHPSFAPIAGPSSSPYPSVMTAGPGPGPGRGPGPGISSTHRALMQHSGRPMPSPPPRLSVSQFLDTLDLMEYANTFIEEGFDRMESLMEIQEEDFAAMGIKRGHRRVIQRELATLRGIPPTTPLIIGNKDLLAEEDEATPPTPLRETVQQTNKNTFYLERPSLPQQTSSEPGTKRRYRRHPKADPNAPEKPPSAYVEFSNSVRDDFKGKSFTEIARLVGEMWQNLDKEEKERLEAHAGQGKLRYASLLAAYKATPEYAQYQEYLADFKKKHPPDQVGTPSQDVATPTGITPPPLHSRSSGEESTVEGHDLRYSRESRASPPDPRKRQRLESAGPVDRNSAWERDAATRLQDGSEHRTVTATSDLRSSRPALPLSQPDSYERGSPG